MKSGRRGQGATDSRLDMASTLFEIKGEEEVSSARKITGTWYSEMGL